MPLPSGASFIIMALLSILLPYILPTLPSIMAQVTIALHVYSIMHKLGRHYARHCVGKTVNLQGRYDRLWVRFKRIMNERNMLRAAVAELEAELGAARETIRRFMEERDDDTLPV